MRDELLEDLIRWYYYDGSVGGFEQVKEKHEVTFNTVKYDLDVKEPRP